MGFCDIIGTVMNQVKAECQLTDVAAGFLPSMIFIWFFVVPIPAAILCGRAGRKNTTLIALAITLAAMNLPLVADARHWWIYAIAFALLGIGNAMLQAALPALLSNVVESGKLTARISLGQFVKAMCAALTPVFIYVTATELGNWKLVFPLYGIFNVIVIVWLAMTGMPDERWDFNLHSDEPTSFVSCLMMLRNPYVLAMTVGILFSIGTDVGFAVAIPEYLKNVYRVDLNTAGVGPTVYFVAKTIAAVCGAYVFSRVSAAKCFPWFMGVGVLATAAIFVAPSAPVFFVCVFVAALMTANSFGMCMGLAIGRVPEKTNEITSLMVMAIVGGAVVTPVLGYAQGALGAKGILLVLVACIAYLLVLGFFAGRSAIRAERNARDE